MSSNRRGLRVAFFFLAGFGTCGLLWTRAHLPERLVALSKHFHFTQAGELLVMSLLPFIVFFIAFRELGRYRNWRRGKVDVEDLALDMEGINERRDWRAFKEQGTLLLAQPEILREEAQQVLSRAKRRWPTKKPILQRLLRRWPTRQEWSGITVIIVGEVLFAVMAWVAPKTMLNFELTDSYRRMSVIVTVTVVMVMNVVMLFMWIAGDDDEGGPRDPRPAPVPGSGHGVEPQPRNPVMPQVRPKQAAGNLKADKI